MQKDIKTKLKVGIDAKWYFEGPPSGKMVVRNLVNHLLKLDSGSFEFVYILRHADKNLNFDIVNENASRIYLKSYNNLLSNVFQIPIIAKKYKIDLVIYQNFISFFGAHKKIAYIHDVIFLTHPQFYTLKERTYFWPLKYLSKFSDMILTISFSERDRMVNKRFSSKEKIEVLHHGVDRVFKPYSGFSQNEKEFLTKRIDLPDKYILYVGRINKRKNIPSLLKAFSNLLLQHDINLVLVGARDWMGDTTEELIEKEPLKSRIFKYLNLSNEELAFVYSKATIFCFPSYEEGFGLPPLEAMACGLPVIVSDSSSLPEICGDAGIYVNPELPEEIKIRIEELLENENLRQDKIQKSILRAKDFSWEKTTEKLINLLTERYGG